MVMSLIQIREMNMDLSVMSLLLTSIFIMFGNMERRCYDPKCPAYSTYGAKGIIVSEEFKIYSNFRRWYEENGVAVIVSK